MKTPTVAGQQLQKLRERRTKLLRELLRIERKMVELCQEKAKKKDGGK